MSNLRIETDFLGELEIPATSPFGIQTWRAKANFAFSAELIDPGLFKALIMVKQAAGRANLHAGLIDEKKAAAIDAACATVLADVATYIPPLHPLQGGAGTSTNMAANELLANLALVQMGRTYGDYAALSPLDDVNLSQSTNDTYPSAVKIAILKGLKPLHQAVEELLKTFLAKEKEFAAILKIGRTELQDAMPMSLGQEFSAWAEALSRFRWRLDKAADWIREVNLSGTAIGTGINADRDYARFVIEELRRITQEPLALSRNLIDGTQNVDQIVEISGLIKTGAVSLKKIAADLRLLSSGPNCGLHEITLPPLQAGSTIMPGKVNPVMLEAAEQICLTIIGNDTVIAMAAAESNLELPQFLPLIAHCILKNIALLTALCERLIATIAGITANTAVLAHYVNHSFAIATLLAPTLGYDVAAALVKEAEQTGQGIIDLLRAKKLLDEQTLARLLTPEVMASPGLPLSEDR